MATILLPAALRRLLPAPAGDFVVEARTVGEALAALAAEHPPLASVLFDGDGGLRRFVRIYVGEAPIESLGGLAAPLSAKDEILLVTPIAGG